MKKMLIFSIIVAAAVYSFVGCTKVDPLPFYEKGTAMTLKTDKLGVVATPADSNNTVVSFNWTNPKFGSDSSTFKYILEIDSTGRSFAKEYTKIVIGKLNTGLTGKELNSILLNFGFPLNTLCTLDFRILGSYGNNNDRLYSNIVKVAVTPYSDPAVLTSAQTSVTCALATSTNLSNTFNWTNAFNGYAGTVTYSIQYDSAGKNFVAPQEIAVGASLYTKAMTQAEMNTSALNSGIAGGNTGKVEYRVKAVTTQGATSYSNVVMVTIQSYVPILRMYMPGGYQSATGYGTDWTPADAPEFIRDTRSAAMNKIYYTYVYLPAGAQFKITQGRSWTTSWGPSTATTGTSGSLTAGSSNNFSVSTAGVYRISFDISNLTYDVRSGMMGFVGGAVPGNNWTPATSFTDVNSTMGLVRRDQFIGVNDFTASGWKIIDNTSWNNGNVDITNNRSYGSTGGDGSPMEINGANMPDIATAGRYRVIWDGTDPNNIKYFINSATQMRVVGDGINVSGVNDWDPPTSPQMTYLGNGKWQISLALKANKSIKFLAGAAWGAFDYEDDGAGTGAGVRKLKWDGGNNFSTPSTAGTYTIILDEKAGTVSIN